MLQMLYVRSSEQKRFLDIRRFINNKYYYYYVLVPQTLVRRCPKDMISEADYSENTPLHIAAQNGFIDCVKVPSRHHLVILSYILLTTFYKIYVMNNAKGNICKGV